MGHRPYIPALITVLCCLLAGCGGNKATPSANAIERLEKKLDQILAKPNTVAPVSQPSASPGLQELQELLKELRTSVKSSDQRLASLEGKVDKLQQVVTEPSDANSGSDDGLELHTKHDAEKLISNLGKTPPAEKFAEALATLDGWITAPEEANTFQDFKLSQVAVLRQIVKSEVEKLHTESLKSVSGSKAVDFHAKASQILALYPMDSTKSALDEARTLSSRHSEVGARIEVIRRQRYNAWAMTQIEGTIKAINEIATSFGTSDNPKTIAATVTHLGEIDPLLLEPVVAQLYNYAVEQAKNNVSSEQQLELGRRMIDPAIKRKGYGDF